MANCHSSFQQFNANLIINKSKRDRLISAKDALRKKIRDYFSENHPEYKMDFYIQGSYKMKTMIRTKDDTCDLDDGIHFKLEPDVSPSTLQKWVYNAVKDHTEGGAMHKSKCIRVIYKGDFHIDLPVYKQADSDNYPYLAVKGKGWDEEESDPKGFVEWFNNRKSEQLLKVTRYLKAWGDTKSKKMPSGLAMTLFAEKYLIPNDRDDVALKDTLVFMKAGLSANWSAYMPTRPFDNILSRYDETFKSNFFDALDAFIEDATIAVNEDSQLKASKLWRKHLGSRFPLEEDKESDNKNAILEMARSGTHKPYYQYSNEGLD